MYSSSRVKVAENDNVSRVFCASSKCSEVRHT